MLKLVLSSVISSNAHQRSIYLLMSMPVMMARLESE